MCNYLMACSASFPRVQNASFLIFTLNLFQGVCWRSVVTAACELILIEVDGKCQPLVGTVSTSHPTGKEELHFIHSFKIFVDKTSLPARLEGRKSPSVQHNLPLVCWVYVSVMCLGLGGREEGKRKKEKDNKSSLFTIRAFMVGWKMELGVGYK